MRLKDFAIKLKEAEAHAETAAYHGMNRITDRHLARYVDNLPVGLSPSSPEAREQAARTGVIKDGQDYVSEVYNTAPHAGFLEKGHRQGAVGRTIFIPLREGITVAYGQAARRNPKTGQWGIWLHLKAAYVKGNFAMGDSEAIAHREINQLAARLLRQIGEDLT